MNNIFNAMLAISAALYLCGALVYVRIAFTAASRTARLAFTIRMASAVIIAALAFRSDERAAIVIMIYVAGAIQGWRDAARALLEAGRTPRGSARAAARMLSI